MMRLTKIPAEIHDLYESASGQLSGRPTRAALIGVPDPEVGQTNRRGHVSLNVRKKEALAHVGSCRCVNRSRRGGQRESPGHGGGDGEARTAKRSGGRSTSIHRDKAHRAHPSAISIRSTRIVREMDREVDFLPPAFGGHGGGRRGAR